MRSRPAALALGDVGSLGQLLGRLQAQRSLTSLPPERFAAAWAVAERFAAGRAMAERPARHTRRPTVDRVVAELAWAVGLVDDERGRLLAAAQELEVRVAPSGVGPALNRYERLLEALSPTTGNLGSLLAGASRRVRSDAVFRGQPGPAGATAEVLSSVAAPVLVAYGLWVLDEAERAGLARLYAGPGATTVIDIIGRLAGPRGLALEFRRLPWDWAAVPLASAEAARHGLLDGVASGVVEVGWTGATGAAIDAALLGVPAHPLAVSYSFGLRAGSGRSVGPPRRAYLFDRSRLVGPVLDDVVVEAMVEAFCAPPAGDVVLDTVDRLALDGELVDLSADLRPAVTGLLTTLARDPTAAEARAWVTVVAGTEVAGRSPWPAAARQLRPAPMRWITDRPHALFVRGRRKLVKVVRQAAADR